MDDREQTRCECVEIIKEKKSEKNDFKPRKSKDKTSSKSKNKSTYINNECPDDATNARDAQDANNQKEKNKKAKGAKKDAQKKNGKNGKSDAKSSSKAANSKKKQEIPPGANRTVDMYEYSDAQEEPPKMAVKRETNTVISETDPVLNRDFGAGSRTVNNIDENEQVEGCDLPPYITDSGYKLVEMDLTHLEETVMNKQMFLEQMARQKAAAKSASVNTCECGDDYEVTEHSQQTNKEADHSHKTAEDTAHAKSEKHTRKGSILKKHGSEKHVVSKTDTSHKASKASLKKSSPKASTQDLNSRETKTERSHVEKSKPEDSVVETSDNATSAATSAEKPNETDDSLRITDMPRNNEEPSHSLANTTNENVDEIQNMIATQSETINVAQDTVDAIRNFFEKLRNDLENSTGSSEGNVSPASSPRRLHESSSYQLTISEISHNQTDYKKYRVEYENSDGGLGHLEFAYLQPAANVTVDDVTQYESVAALNAAEESQINNSGAIYSESAYLEQLNNVTVDDVTQYGALQCDNNAQNVLSPISSPGSPNSHSESQQSPHLSNLTEYDATQYGDIQPINNAQNITSPGAQSPGSPDSHSESQQSPHLSNLTEYDATQYGDIQPINNAQNIISPEAQSPGSPSGHSEPQQSSHLSNLTEYDATQYGDIQPINNAQNIISPEAQSPGSPSGHSEPEQSPLPSNLTEYDATQYGDIQPINNAQNIISSPGAQSPGSPSSPSEPQQSPLPSNLTEIDATQYGALQPINNAQNIISPEAQSPGGASSHPETPQSPLPSNLTEYDATQYGAIQPIANAQNIISPEAQSPGSASTPSGSPQSPPLSNLTEYDATQYGALQPISNAQNIISPDRPQPQSPSDLPSFDQNVISTPITTTNQNQQAHLAQQFKRYQRRPEDASYRHTDRRLIPSVKYKGNFSIIPKEPQQNIRSNRVNEVQISAKSTQTTVDPTDPRIVKENVSHIRITAKEYIPSENYSGLADCSAIPIERPRLNQQYANRSPQNVTQPRITDRRNIPRAHYSGFADCSTIAHEPPIPIKQRVIEKRCSPPVAQIRFTEVNYIPPAQNYGFGNSSSIAEEPPIPNEQFDDVDDDMFNAIKFDDETNQEIFAQPRSPERKYIPPAQWIGYADNSISIDEAPMPNEQFDDINDDMFNAIKCEDVTRPENITQSRLSERSYIPPAQCYGFANSSTTADELQIPNERFDDIDDDMFNAIKCEDITRPENIAQSRLSERSYISPAQCIGFSNDSTTADGQPIYDEIYDDDEDAFNSIKMISMPGQISYAGNVSPCYQNDAENAADMYFQYRQPNVAGINRRVSFDEKSISPAYPMKQTTPVRRNIRQNDQYELGENTLKNIKCFFDRITTDISELENIRNPAGRFNNQPQNNDFNLAPSSTPPRLQGRNAADAASNVIYMTGVKPIGDTYYEALNTISNATAESTAGSKTGVRRKLF